MHKNAINLNYLNNKPYMIYWQVIAGDPKTISILQDHDLIFDDYDLKIRKITNVVRN